MQTEFFLRKLACFDNQNSRTQKRPALIHQQIPDERDCYSKHASQSRIPIFFLDLGLVGKLRLPIKCLAPDWSTNQEIQNFVLNAQ